MFELRKSSISQKVVVAGNGFPEPLLEALEGFVVFIGHVTPTYILLQLPVGLLQLYVFIEEASVELLVPILGPVELFL